MNSLGEDFRFTDHKVDWQSEEIEVSYSVRVLGPVTFSKVVHTRDSWLNGGHPPVLEHGPGSLSYMQVKGCENPMA
jgi:hypothetical protein